MCPQLQSAPLGSPERLGAGAVTSGPSGKPRTQLRGQGAEAASGGTLNCLETVCLLGLVSRVPVLKFFFYFIFLLFTSSVKYMT